MKISDEEMDLLVDQISDCLEDDYDSDENICGRHLERSSAKEVLKVFFDNH